MIVDLFSNLHIMITRGGGTVIPLEAGLIIPIMSYTVYILKSEPVGKYYIGHTNNIVRRLKEHNSSELAKFTKPYQPWLLVYKEACETRAKAMQLERYIKSLKNKERLRQYIKGWRSSKTKK